MVRTRLSCVEFGTLDAPHVIVMLAGFPDHETSGWGDILTSLNDKDVRILCLCLPEFENNCSNRRPWGYTFDEILDLMHATINERLGEEKRKVTLFIHDWGAYTGLLYENRYPSRVEKIVCFDVAAGISSGKSKLISPFFIVLLYQLWWAWAYFLSQAVYKPLGFAVFLSYGLLVPKFLRPTSLDKKDVPRPQNEIVVDFLYPYYTFWKQALTSGNPKSLAPKRVSCPILFLYGLNKNVFFHNAKFLRDIEARDDGSKYVALDCSHWIDRGPAAATAIAEIDKFLK